VEVAAFLVVVPPSPGLPCQGSVARFTMVAPEASSLKAFIPNIVVVGAGGGGGNVIAHMVRVGVSGVNLVACNTDMQALRTTRAGTQILLGRSTRKGRGAGADPEVGRRAAQDTEQELAASLGEAAMVFIAAGLGGGTGTGSAPIIARLAKAMGALTVAVVTLPFAFEGRRRINVARSGLLELAPEVDMILVIPNDRLLEVSPRNMTLLDAFARVDGVMVDVIQGITDLITHVGLINVDFADVRTVMENRGGGVIGKGTGRGEHRLDDAVQAALNNPLMGEVNLSGAKGVLVHIMGNEGLGLLEITEAMETLTNRMGSEVNLIFGATTNERMGDSVSLMMIATGVDNPFLPAGAR
jgi:cell division protein FtsZ